jgi:transketolase
LEQGNKHPNLVVLDADLVLDTGLIPFRDKHPDRFFECGIAEQDMVSMAGGMALRGLLPVVHSFACFLSARPNEQIYNNATEKTRVIYVGSLAGVVPGGPGHSHQAVRDISAVGAIPRLVIMEPCCEAEVGMLLDWAINQNSSSCYLRLVSLPWVVPYNLPKTYRLELGKGVALTDGTNVAIIAYGPVMLSAAVNAAQALREKSNIYVKVINLPWLNQIDGNWLASELGEVDHCFSFDNHYCIGGQGDRIANAISAFTDKKTILHRVAIEQIPACGTNSEIIWAHGFNASKLAEKIQSVIGGQ